MARLRRESRTPAEIWPGFVDALSTLLLVTIFMLSVFMLAQFFLGQLLQGQDERLVAMQRELSTTQNDLESERLRLDDLRRSLAQLNTDLGLTRSERDAAEAALNTTLDERDDLDRRLARAVDDANRLEASLLAAERDAAAIAQDRRAIEQALLAAEGRIEADRATIEAQLSDLAALRQEVDTLQSLRDRLEGAIATQAALLGELEAANAAQDEELEAARAALSDRDQALELSDAAQAALRRALGQVRDRALDLEAELTDADDRTLAAQRALRDAQRSIAEGRAAATALAEELAATRGQLARIEALLVERDDVIAAQETQITDLDTRLAAALAQEVDELQRFRSDFFGRLREVLGDRDDVRVVGDRFVFQSEVLFDRGEATLGVGAQGQLRSLAQTLTTITADLPPDLPWILQVNGHTDRRPIRTARFPSNWELSTARAISVARFLIAQGIPADRVAAAGFAEFQPLDPADTEQAYQRNRRIEVKLTTR